MAQNLKYSTPRVPVQTPMFNEDKANDLTLTRTWIIFFERLGRLFESTTGGAPGAAGPYQRTLLLKDTTVGDDIADHVTVWGQGGKITLVTGVLRTAITEDLTVRIKVDGVTLGSFTIPQATAVDTPVEFTLFSAAATVTLEQVFSWDVTASDGSIDGAGVASFTVLWEPA